MQQKLPQNSNRSQSQRNAALAGFQQGRYRVLVATDVASRGIHVQDIAHVINYDLPDDAENFIHRVGRTGRAGTKGIASTLFGREQRSDLMLLERKLGIQIERVREIGGEAPTRPASSQGRIPASQPLYARPHKAFASGGNAVGSTSQFTIGRLPGEVLQAQIEG
jgi:superfamily II DNA/RNA helicase